MPPRVRTLEEIWQAWRSSNPPNVADGMIPGYRKCATRACPTQIEVRQARQHCYFHGGQPDDKMQPLPKMAEPWLR